MPQSAVERIYIEEYGGIFRNMERSIWNKDYGKLYQDGKKHDSLKRTHVFVQAHCASLYT